MLLDLVIFLKRLALTKLTLTKKSLSSGISKGETIYLLYLIKKLKAPIFLQVNRKTKFLKISED